MNRTDLIPKKLLAGTTQEQWERYADDCINHERFCKHMEIAFSRAVWVVSTYKLVDADLAAKIKSALDSELSKEHSIGAPNRPGYYIANND